MFKIFKKKSKTGRLTNKYRKLLKEAHALSTKNRKESDAKYAEADATLKEIERILKQS